MTDPHLSGPPVERRPLDAAQVPGWRVEHVARTASTNAVVASRTDPGLVVVADHQQAGRGRLDRAWETPAGLALTFSALVDPGVPDARWPWLPLLTGLAVADAVRRSTGVGALLKWPNDVLVADRKVAGILVERVSGNAGPLAVVGIGVNVHQTELRVPSATSLALEGAPVDRADLLEAVLERLAAELADWRGRAGDPVRLREGYQRFCSTLGRRVAVRLPGERSLRGLAESVDEQGRLVVLEDAGSRTAVGAGDVVHVRPSG